jgi:hypothetical protein
MKAGNMVQIISAGLDTSSILKAGSAIRFLPRHLDLGTLTTLSRGIKNGFDLHPDRFGAGLSTTLSRVVCP